MEEIWTILHYKYWAQSAFLTLVGRSHKLDPKSLPCVFIGYSMKHKGYKCLYPLTRQVYISRNVVFDESIFPYSTPTSFYKSDPLKGELCIFLEREIDPQRDSLPPYSTPLSIFAPPESQDITGQLHHQLHHTSSSTKPPTVTISGSSLSEPCQASYSDPPIETTPIPPETNPTQHPMLTCSKVGACKPNPKYVNLHIACIKHDIPTKLRSIQNVKRHPGWVAAMDEEMNALAINKTWTLVPYNAEMNVVGCKWVYKAKLKLDGSLE